MSRPFLANKVIGLVTVFFPADVFKTSTVMELDTSLTSLTFPQSNLYAADIRKDTFNTSVVLRSIFYFVVYCGAVCLPPDIQQFKNIIIIIIIHGFI